MLTNLFKNLKFTKHSEFWFLGIATFLSLAVGGPIVLFGLDKINLSIASAFIGLFLIMTGIMQYNQKKKHTDKKLDVTDSIITGLLQGLASLPGISRSGITTSTLLVKNYSPNDALKLSFLLSIPLVLASSIYLGISEPILFQTNTLITLAVSFVTGLLSISLFMKVAKKVNFSLFCIVMGIIAIIATFI